MSAVEPPVGQPETTLGELPSFTLEFGVDDLDEPTEVTVYDSTGPDPTTTWLSADVDTAVDLRYVA